MHTQDKKTGLISNPRLLAAAYFGLLALILTIFFDTLLFILGINEYLPIAKAILLAVVIAASFGALFAKKIIHSTPPYHWHVFLWAFLMVMVALPFYNAGFIYFLKADHTTLFAQATLTHLVYLYFFTLAYHFVTAGVWVALIAGLTAIYLRSHVVYYFLHSLHQERQHHHLPAHINTLKHEEEVHKKQ